MVNDARIRGRHAGVSAFPQILLLEADAGLSSLYHRALMTRGYVVHLAATVEEALGYLTLAVPEVALIDLRPPQLAGQQLITYCQQHAPQTALIAMTIQFPPPALSGVPLLVKPFPLPHLWTLVETCLAARRRLAPSPVETTSVPAVARTATASLDLASR
jgi:DNA-binding NtrC family response regulator